MTTQDKAPKWRSDNPDDWVDIDGPDGESYGTVESILVVLNAYEKRIRDLEARFGLMANPACLCGIGRMIRHDCPVHNDPVPVGHELTPDGKNLRWVPTLPVFDDDFDALPSTTKEEQA